VGIGEYIGAANVGQGIVDLSVSVCTKKRVVKNFILKYKFLMTAFQRQLHVSLVNFDVYMT
jgi:hypothetical protein